MVFVVWLNGANDFWPLWPFAVVLLAVVWGVRVRNERTFEEEFAMWMKTYGRAG